MTMFRRHLAAVLPLLVLAAVANPAARGLTVAYDNLSTPLRGFVFADNTPGATFGDQLTLSSPGTLAGLRFTIGNPPAAPDDLPILRGNVLITLYDDTAPYSGGLLDEPVLYSFTYPVIFDPPGLASGAFSTFTAFTPPDANVLLPQHILITQRFTLTAGSSTTNGIAVYSNPDVGSSPDTLYGGNTAGSGGLFSFPSIGGQVGYTIYLADTAPSAVPLPAVAPAAVAILAPLFLRRGGARPAR